MISFIYFDVGGVAIKDFSDTPKWENMMDDMGVAIVRRDEFTSLYKKYDTEICVGLDIDTLIPIFQESLALNLPADFSLLNYFVDHFEQNTSIWPVMEAAKKLGRVGLLTDMYPRMLDTIKKHGLLAPIEWDIVIDSSVEKVRKPTKEIFDLAAHRAGVKPEEILFIDNRQWNVDGAKVMGWQTYLYDSSNYEKSSRDLAVFLSQNL
jgi:HAD superfamily hydrolase (TIGR01509 family)